MKNAKPKRLFHLFRIMFNKKYVVFFNKFILWFCFYPQFYYIMHKTIIYVVQLGNLQVILLYVSSRKRKIHFTVQNEKSSVLILFLYNVINVWLVVWFWNWVEWKHDRLMLNHCWISTFIHDCCSLRKMM